MDYIEVGDIVTLVDSDLRWRVLSVDKGSLDLCVEGHDNIEVTASVSEVDEVMTP